MALRGIKYQRGVANGGGKAASASATNHEINKKNEKYQRQNK